MTNKIILTPASKFVLYKNLFVPVFLICFFLVHIPTAKVSAEPAPFSFNKETIANFSSTSLYDSLPQSNDDTASKQLRYAAALINDVLFRSGSFSDSLYRHNPGDTIPFNFIRRDTANTIRYLVNGTILISADSISFSLNDSLVVNYRRWNISAGNRISFSKQGTLITSFLLTRDTANISLVSRQNLVGSPIDVSIQNFNINDIRGVFNQDSLTASGLLDAKIGLSGFGKLLREFTATAFLRNFALGQQPVGTLQVAAQMRDDNTLHTTIGLTENGNDVNVSANILLNNGFRQVDALLDIKKLQVLVLRGLLKNKVIPISGTVNGLIALKGTLKQPQWTGSLNFDTAKFILNQFGAAYIIDKQKIAFDYPAIGFNRFIVKDSLDHSLTVNGIICATSTKEYELNLNLDSKEFTLITAPKAINNKIYGNAVADAKVTVTGTTLSPLIDGNIHLVQKTDVTLVVPEKNTNKDAARSVVRFIRKSDTAAFRNKAILGPLVSADTSLSRLHYKLNIQADSQSALTIVIDPTTGDELKVKGMTQLNAVPGATGNLALSGVYRLDSGYYELNYQFLRKRFNLIPGSTITFNGVPTDARINITAEYIANTAARDLLGNEVGSVDPKIARSFVQKIPFRVILSLKGSLNQPAISFDIELPDDKSISSQLRTTIENKLVQLRADVATTNKQVFALLVLERFVGEQSIDFFKGNGSDFSNINGESVSKFLSGALDEIASDLFKGINVDLNLNSYKDFINNDEAQKTDLNVEVSKNFLNDRLSVTVGRNFGIESQDASAKAAQQKASRFLPDVTVNYKLSTDGKYMIRSYKKSPYEVILDGYVVETGLAFIMTMDFDMFNELFYKKRKKTIE